MSVLAYSIHDPAGVNMAKWFKSNGFNEREKFHELNCWSNKETLLVETLEETINFSTQFETDLLVFVSKHASASKKPCLTAHFTGNWGPAEHGGNKKQLSLAHPSALKEAYSFLLDHPLEKFPTILEATHHGPTSLPCPMLFVEVGSSKGDWENEFACEIVARACLKACEAPKSSECVIGIGGGHYCPKFSELENEFSFSHICPKYVLEFFDSKMLLQTLNKAGAPVKKVFVDKKGCGKHKARIIDLLQEKNLDFELV